MNSLTAILPELLLSVGAILLMIVAAFGGARVSRLNHVLAVILLLGATVALIGPAQTDGPLFGGLIVADGFGAFGKLIIFLSAAVAIVAAHGWFERGFEHGAEYPVLILFSAVGMAVMVSATNLMTLYVGVELQSLAAYVLASYRRTDERSAEAGLNYFVLGGLASGILLYGISLLYGFTGTMGFTGIAASFAREGVQSTGMLFGLVFLLAGLAFKASVVPFHMWTPDVYEGSPTPVTAFMSAATKAAAFAALFRVLVQALPGVSEGALEQVAGDLPRRLEAVVTQLGAQATAETVARALFADEPSLEVLSQRPVRWACTCSKQRVMNALSAMGKAELQDILVKEGKAVATCQFCGRTHTADAEDLQTLLLRLGEPAQ